MKKQSSRIFTKFKYPLILLLALTLLLNAAMLSGCDAFAALPSDNETKAKENNENTPEKPETPGDELGGEEDNVDKGPNYAIKELFESTKDEAKEFFALPILEAPANAENVGSLPSTLFVTVKNGAIFHIRKTYALSEYVTEGKIEFHDSINNKLSSSDSDLSESAREALNKIKEQTEYYLMYRYDSDQNPLIVLSIDDTVYLMYTAQNKVFDILNAFNVNSPHLPVVPSDDKYNGEKNHVIRSLFERSATSAQEFHADPYLKNPSTSSEFSIDVEIKNGKDVYLNGDLYGQAVYTENHDAILSQSLSLDAETWKHFNADLTYAATLKILEKLDTLGEYYVVTPVAGAKEVYGNRVLLCSIGDSLYVLSYYETLQGTQITRITSGTAAK